MTGAPREVALPSAARSSCMAAAAPELAPEAAAVEVEAVVAEADTRAADPCSAREQRKPPGSAGAPAHTVEWKPGFIPGVTMQLLLQPAFSSPALGGSAGGS
jgi:hypothetical protein